jgi:hypothetical protein
MRKIESFYPELHYDEVIEYRGVICPYSPGDPIVSPLTDQCGNQIRFHGPAVVSYVISRLSASGIRTHRIYIRLRDRE